MKLQDKSEGVKHMELKLIFNAFISWFSQIFSFNFFKVSVQPLVQVVM